MTEYSDPKSWGPHFWFVMRCTANNFPDNPSINDAKYYVDFFTNLKNILPCPKCSTNYTKLLERYPIEQFAVNRDKLIKWVQLIYEETKKDKATQIAMEAAEKFKRIKFPPKFKPTIRSPRVPFKTPFKKVLKINRKDPAPAPLLAAAPPAPTVATVANPGRKRFRLRPRYVIHTTDGGLTGQVGPAKADCGCNKK